VKKILIVEDNEVNLELATQLLEDDFELFTARDGQEGVAMASSCRPDLILMDLSLPRMNGWDATRALRADPALAGIPIIALTAHAVITEIQSALDAGCNACVTKPIDEEILLAEIAKQLAATGSSGA
jgi:two-component system cell cycle response regulator DivK